MKNIFGSFSRTDFGLWAVSELVIIVSFLLFDRENYITFAASMIGAASLIFCAKGNPVGQVLIIIFAALYAVISFRFRYYGEMITYLGMTAPMAVLALISWLRNMSGKNSSEVAVNRLERKEYLFIAFLTAVVTFIFYFILKAFNTANLFISTLSITTSFSASYLTFRRSPFYALAYAANDLILIILWTLGAVSDISCLTMISCFVIFLINDFYGFISWKKMQHRQQSA